MKSLNEGKARMLWVNVYADEYGDPIFGSAYATKAIADRTAGRDRLACLPLHIPYEEWERKE